MTTSTTPEPPATAPLVDLRALVVAVRRRRRFWCCLALIGLLAGTAAAVLLPAPPSAVTTVLVAHQADQPNDPGTLIRTDAALLQTVGIAGAALKSLGSAEKPADLLPDYTALGLTNNLLQITVKGSTEAEAVARAKALAEAFVADHVRRINETADAEAKSLLDQRDRMQAELNQVNKDIGDTPQQSGAKTSAQLEALYASRAELTSRIADFGRRAGEAHLGTPRLIAGTQIVDAPHAVKVSRKKTAATDAAIGAVLGLVVGLTVAAVGAVVADRPVLRRDVAENLGASVLAELRPVPRRTVGRWQRARTRAARERLTTTLARTVRGSAEPVSLLDLGSARTTVAVALDLAAALKEQGPVVVVDGLPGRQLAKLRPGPEGPTVVRGDQAADRPDGPVGPDEPAGSDGPDGSDGTRRIGVGSVAPGTAWTDLRHLGTRTVLVVRAGRSSAAWLHTVARQLADQRIPVIGVVLVDPDPRDRTDGTLWDGPHPVTRGRFEWPSRRSGPGRRRTGLTTTWTARVPDSDQEVR
ncbi:Wzz/FepE/Etk N-terminal domain-containing protein [Kitasatospora sp. NPDC093806]|uniref:Wzz/FepE/Etk N-terminal domain-containing protein n=1 Tax=Kitasatospora sp. NPDC093806 TaxID=3155075 RepID=UPI0034443605